MVYSFRPEVESNRSVSERFREMLCAVEADARKSAVAKVRPWMFEMIRS